jgi:hypothetical protein
MCGWKCGVMYHNEKCHRDDQFDHFAHCPNNRNERSFVTKKFFDVSFDRTSLSQVVENANSCSNEYKEKEFKDLFANIVNYILFLRLFRYQSMILHQ